MSHELHMKRAIELARSVDLARDVNPHVGAVVVSADGRIIGEGFHRGSGTQHAEVVALENAGAGAQGSTVYVTLEPCNGTGRQGPCTQVLIDAGVARVVFGQQDPNDAMAGGAAALRAAGIDVVAGVLISECRELNATWTFAHTNGRPWVKWKTATTLDGFIAATDGTSKWITGEPARAEVQNIRRSVGAIVTGTGTVLADNPAMTVRDLSAEQQPLRVIVGARAIPADYQIMQGTHPAITVNEDLPDVLAGLWLNHKIHSVLVEAGSALSTSAWASGLVDEVFWFQAPVIMGTGIPALADIGVSAMVEARRFTELDVNRVGLDLLIHFTTR